MAEPTGGQRSARELEQLWSGDFGEAWVERNAKQFEQRTSVWHDLVSTFPAASALEVGTAHGENLRHLSRDIDPSRLCGHDINPAALAAMADVAPGVPRVRSAARSLPFRDRSFDLVFTVGLLIHQPDDTLPGVMQEIARCSSRWVVSGEYHSDEATSITYRDLDGVLFKRDYGRLYLEHVADLELRETRFLTFDEHGFDRVTLHVFERAAP